MENGKKEAARFVAANDKSPVIYGSAIGNGGQGARYELKDLSWHTLSLAACKALPEGYPKWDI